MTLTGIALCGFLLLALVGTHARTHLFQAAGVLICTVRVIAFVATPKQRPQSTSVASIEPAWDPICHYARLLDAAVSEQMRASPGLPREEEAIFVRAVHHCPIAA